MKKPVWLFTIVLAFSGTWLLWNCCESLLVSRADGELKTSTFKVEGMTCGGCAAGVKMAVRKLEGIEKADVSYEKGRAVVTYDASKVSPKEIVEAIQKLGYKASLLKEDEER